MRLHYIQHSPFEGPASILEWARERGHTAQGTNLYAGEPLPDVSAFDLLVVTGGAMGVSEEAVSPMLEDERGLLEKAIEAGRIVLGISRGAQILAEVLGAAVRQNIVKEIGWFPVSLTPLGWDSPIFGGLPATFEAFHWHWTTFEIPRGAQHIASSEACPNQAFLYEGRVIGVQFHLEVTPQGVEALVQNRGNELEEGEYVQRADRLLGRTERFDLLRRNLYRLLDSMPVPVGH